MMPRSASTLSLAALACGALALGTPALAQTPGVSKSSKQKTAPAPVVMLEPPQSRYFLGKGSWGQSYADQWALRQIGFDDTKTSAWRLVRRDATPVTVAVIDTGQDWNHANISWDQIWRNPKEIDGNGIDDDKNGFVDDVIGWDFFARGPRPWDYDGHGTFVAGIIAASWNYPDGMVGVNPFARLMVLKGIDDMANTRSSFVAQAITYAADNGARVINLSLGGPKTGELDRIAVEYAYAKGAVIVVAAGNEGIGNRDYSFSDVADKVLIVAATDVKDERAVFSNWGGISVAAPGVDILSTRARRTDVLLSLRDPNYKPGEAFVGKDNRFYRASGTSFAAPLVSGLASLMIANNPKLTNRQVMDIVRSTARDVGTPGVDQFTGYGIVDARAALRAPADYRLLAGISGVEVVNTKKGQAVRVRGTADANAFKGARLEVGAGENPKSWKRVGTIAKSAAGPNAVLGDIPASSFAGSSVWQIRVVVTHGNKATREARFRLNLG